jgi:hypothetical protein
MANPKPGGFETAADGFMMPPHALSEMPNPQTETRHGRHD